MSSTIQFDPALKELLLRRTGDPLGGALSEAAAEQEIPVVARLADPLVGVPPLRIVTRFGNVVTGRVTLSRIVEARQHPNVRSLKASWAYRRELAFSVPEINASHDPLAPPPARVDLTGRGVVIGTADWGCDFAHANLRDDDRSTRLLYLWDQRGGAQPESPQPFGYGREFDRDRIDAALAQPDPYRALGYDPADADPGGTGTHCTHVLDIAAGSGCAPGSAPGVAPEADLICVHLRGDDTRPQDTLGDSVRVLEAVRYIVERAGDRPVVINLSLGKTGSPHDASPLVVQGLDSLLDERPGRAIVMSAGNYFGTDMHSAGQLTTGGYADLRWLVMPRNDETAEMEIWYAGADEFVVELIEPLGRTLAVVPLGQDAVIREGDRILASIYHRRHDPNNGDHQIDIFLWPDAALGMWTTRLYGARVVDGRYHAWIERDDPRSQSRFTPDWATQTSTTGTICNGRKTISVGAYDARARARPLAPFSSAGPTRDGRPVPLISAPGVGIRAARSSQPRIGYREMDGLCIKSGTSMAAPHVSGVIALVFQAALPRRLTADQVRAILVATARGSPPDSQADRLRYGAGRVDAGAAIQAVHGLIWPETAPGQAQEARAIAGAAAGTDGARLQLASAQQHRHKEGRMTMSSRHPHDEHPRTQVLRWLTELADSSAEESVFQWMARAPLGTRQQAMAAGVTAEAQAELSEALRDVRALLEQPVLPPAPEGPWGRAMAEEVEQVVFHMYVDADRDGSVDRNHRGLDRWEWGRGKRGAIILVNNDDDDGDNRGDNEDNNVNTASDVRELAPLDIQRIGPAQLPPGWQVEVLVDDPANIRIFDGRGAGQREIIGPTIGATYRLPSLQPTTFRFGVEGMRYAGPGFDGQIRITLRVTDPAGAVVEEHAVVRVAPWMIANHLTPATRVYVVDAGADNQRFRIDLERLVRAAGCTLVQVHSVDIWMQDCMELGYTSLPGHGIHVAMRAARDRPLRAFPRTLLGAEFGYYAPGTLSTFTTFDSTGNLEVTPPVTSRSGKRYPWGRIYYGPGVPGEEIDHEIEEFLARQIVQEPIEIDTAWLTVGHVDEVMTFVPAHGPRHFRLLLASPRRAYQILDGLRASAGSTRMLVGRTLPQANASGAIVNVPVEVSVADFLANRVNLNVVTGLGMNLRTFNDSAQAHLDAIRTQLESELGLDTNDIIEIPAIFMPNEMTPNLADALVAGMVNMLVINGHCIVPKPFGPLVAGRDAFEEDVRRKLDPLGLRVDFLDCWQEYHARLGEVHCGTNTLRSRRIAAWWEFEP